MVPKGLTKDDVDFDATWNVLATAFYDIHGKNASKLSYEELFRSGYKLVLKKKVDMLYDKVVELEQTWLRNNVRQGIVSLITPSLVAGAQGSVVDTQSTERRVAGERFMRALKDSFQDHQMCINMITDVLMYMVSVSLSSVYLDRMLTKQGQNQHTGRSKAIHPYHSHGSIPPQCAQSTY